MKHHAHWPLAAALLVPSSCGAGSGGDARAGDARAGEIACQRRLVALSAGAAPGGGLAGAFARTSEGFAGMPLDGCTDNQRLAARLLARTTRALASTAARVGDLNALERLPELRGSQDFRELQSQIEGFEHRRQALREDLGRMTKDGQ